MFEAVNFKSIRRVRVNALADGDNTIVAAPGAGKALLVIGYQLAAVGAGDATIRSGAAGAIHFVFTGVAAPGTRVSYVADVVSGAFQTDDNQALVVNNAAGVDTTGHLTYRIVSTA